MRGAEIGACLNFADSQEGVLRKVNQYREPAANSYSRNSEIEGRIIYGRGREGGGRLMFNVKIFNNAFFQLRCQLFSLKI